jgi:LmbE family N-acetylglucosaminyl deacetylase
VSVSIFGCFAVAFCVVAVAIFGAEAQLRRRLRHPQLVVRATALLTVVLVPANIFCAFAEQTGTNAVLARTAMVTVDLAALSGLALLLLTNRIERAPVRHPRRVLAIGAHPDDLELGCGATLAKLHDSGHEVHALVMTNGERGGNSSARPDEAMRGGHFVGVTSVRVLGFPDTRLADKSQQMVEAIEEAIRRHNPDIILTHSANDLHQDHCAVHVASLRAARSHSAILCYESPSATKEFQPSVFIDVEDYVDVKVAAVGTHRDQSDKPYMTPERVRGLAVYRGAQAKTNAAEAFEPVRVLASNVGAL